MKVIYDASNNMVIACGMVDEGGVSLPFFGIAKTSLIDPKAVTNDADLVEQYNRHGVVVMMDNIQAAHALCVAINHTLHMAEKTDWSDRELPQGGTQ